MDFGTCPRCHQEISQERRSVSPVICDHCGFSSGKADRKVQGEVESKFIKVSVAISVFLAVGFVQVANWDKHFLSVIPLQVKSLIGMMSQADAEEMAQVCLDRKKYDCVEQMYARTAFATLENRARLADFLSKRDKTRQAAEQYKIYFAQGGVDLMITYNYAKVLAQLGSFDEAAVLFQQVIDAKPETVQITVIQNYVRALINGNQLEKAKALIENVRKQSAQANAFMTEEMNEIMSKGA